MSITKTLGSYDFLHPSQKQWRVCINLPEDAPARHISDTWDEEDEPNIEGLPPSEVVEIIAERVESWLISTSRVAKRATIAWVREHAERLDSEWAEEEIARLEAKRERLAKRIAELRGLLLETV